MAYMQVNFSSKALMRNVTFNAIIPTPSEPAREKKPLKTLYLLHGMYGNYMDWITKTRILVYAEASNLAVIMPSCENSFYLDSASMGNMCAEFIGKELVEATRDMFHLSGKREDTYIAGLSMGGYGAIRNGLKYNDTFGCIAGLSSALIIDSIQNGDSAFFSDTRTTAFYNAVFGDIAKLRGSDKDPKALIENLQKANASIPEIYICCGTEDFLIKQNRDFRAFLEANGVKHTYEEGSGNHTWEFWDSYILKILNWLPLEKSASRES